LKKIDLRKEARGRPCTVRLYGICSGRNDSTVLAHLPSGKKGLKAHDIHGCIACYSCHKWLDEEWTKDDVTPEQRMLVFLEAVIRTQKIWIDEGYI